MKRFSWNKLLVVAAAGLLGGIALAKFGYVSSLGILGVCSMAPILLFRSITSLLLACILCMQLGLMRGEQWQHSLTFYEESFGDSVVLQGKVADDPVYSRNYQTEFHLDSITTGSGQELAGRVRVRSYEAAGLLRGDRVVVVGKLTPGFGNRQGSASFASIEPVSRSSKRIETTRRDFFAATHSVLPDPQSSLGLGFVVGIRALLPEGLLDDLRTTGLTHIVAVSGYNLTILVRLVRRARAGHSKFQAVAGAAGLMLAFIAVVGATPSIMRASIVSSLSLLAWAYGRKPRPLVTLLLAGAITAYIDPFYPWLDLGWYLSFLAFFGVMVLAPAIEARFTRKQLGLVGGVALESFAAQIMVVPLIAYVFGDLSLISLLANVLIVPLIPLAMALTFAASIAQLVVAPIAGWVALPAKILLQYMTELIAAMASWESALIAIEFSLVSLVIVYAAIGLWLLLTLRKRGITLDATRVVT